MIKSNNSEELVEKVFKLVKNGMSISEMSSRIDSSVEECIGLIELCNIYGKELELHKYNSNDYIVIKKTKVNNKIYEKPEKDYLIHTQLLVVSDTHFGNTRQQLHLLNKLYEYAYSKGITTALHCGDIIDGDYTSIRKEQPKYLFLRNFDDFADYVIEMYPLVKGMETHLILGSHDETTYKNGGASLNKWVERSRKDLIFEGQDIAELNINNIKITLSHPGLGSSDTISTKLQKRIENLESGYKPKILLVGHYHKSLFELYRNVYSFLIPCLCDWTHFQNKGSMANVVGGYILDIYSDKKGNIVYLEPEEILYSRKDFWDEAGKDKRKVKQLVIN